jgi:hypothetical protein
MLHHDGLAQPTNCLATHRIAVWPLLSFQLHFLKKKKKLFSSCSSAGRIA